MLNPFDMSGSRDHCPSNFARAFEEVGKSSVNTESLLASKSKMFSVSGNSEVRSGGSLWNKTVEEEKFGLKLADLTSNDTFAISKSSEVSEFQESRSFKPPRPGNNEKFGASGQTLNSEGTLISDKAADSTIINSEKSLKLNKKSNGATSTSKLIHCKTCKCLESSHSTIKGTDASESLRFLSKLESMPKKQGQESELTSRFTFNKPYTSPLFTNAKPPSQVFRQRINSHILTSQLKKQVSMPVFTFKN